MGTTTTVGRRGDSVIIELADDLGTRATITMSPFAAECMAEELRMLAMRVRVSQAEALAAARKEEERG